MAKFAIITNVGVDAFRDIDPGTVPKHKLAPDGGPIARPVVENVVPAFRPELAQLKTSIVVEPSRVVIDNRADPFPIEVQRLAIKTEARRRILARLPDWKQANMTARGVELQDIWRRNGAWTPEEQREADALNATWSWIKAVRDASNAIEALDAVPDDFDADKRWPA